MRAQVKVTKDGKFEAFVEDDSIAFLCSVVHDIVGWCDAFDLVLDVLNRSGSYFVGVNGYEARFEVVA